MTLKEHLVAQIRQSGPITIASYMRECLLHPKLGYYSTRDPLGAKGDFVTAPEISQMFGELLGMALAQAWIDQGQPSPFTLAELGPGRGTLMADLLRATRIVPGFHEAARLALVDASEPLRKAQHAALSEYDPEWIDDISDLPAQPLFLVANEFFDALPIHQFVRDENAWRERQVGVQGDALVLGLSEPVSPKGLSHRLSDTKDGDVVELCSAIPQIIADVGQRIAGYGGVALIIDYGDWHTLGDTLQALKAHEPVEILSTPGQADLTAHVDFEAVASAAQTVGCAHTRLTTQGVFLERLGITARAQALAASLGGDALKNHVAAHRRLTHPSEMGNLFKTLGLYPRTATPPPGLEP